MESEDAAARAAATKWAETRWAPLRAWAEKTAQAGRAVTGADQTPSVPESGARKSSPDTALATPPASCGDAAAGNPGVRKCAAGCPLDCQEETKDDRCSKDASGTMT